MKHLSERSRKIDIWKAYEQLQKETERHQKVMQGLSEEFSILQHEHHRLQEKTDFIDGLRKRLTALNERMDLLTKISQDLNSLDLDRILDLCISKIPFLVNAKYTSIYLYDPERDALNLRKSNHDRSLRLEIPRGEGPTLMELAIERGRILVIADLDEFARTSEGGVVRPYADRYATKSCIVAPLVAGDQLVGVINFADRNDGAPFEARSDLQPIRALVGVLAASIRNVQLYGQVQRQSTLDGLTGLLNHSAFTQTLEREVQRAKRYDIALSLILADVDRFRSHNANLGHEGGDAILRMISGVIARTVRRVDLAGRYGADEFALILPETTLDGAKNVAGRLLDGVREEKFTYGGRPYPISLSAGVATLSTSGDHEELLSIAEGALQGLRKEGKRGTLSAMPPRAD